MEKQQVRELALSALRVLSVDAIDRANSGHPGICLGAAPAIYAVYAENMTYSVKDSKWINRDRFVLSAGHGSALLYSMLHLCGFGITATDIANFRQYGSITPGHPEAGVTDGVDCSTGPLGQGIANAVGMAIAERKLADKFNREGFPVFDHYTFALSGDGCFMEGVEYEAAALAGKLGLSKLIVLYDKNDITIEGDTSVATCEDVGARHAAQGWNVIKVKSKNDPVAISKAIKKAKLQHEKPTLIICPSTIGFGSSKAGTSAVHGAPLGAEANAETRKNFGWNYEPFIVPDEVYQFYDKIARKGLKKHAKWKKMMRDYRREFPELYAELNCWFGTRLPRIDVQDKIWMTEDKKEATRVSGNKAINKLAEALPNLIGGSADLAPSNLAFIKDGGYISADDFSGRNIHFGIREHAMGAVCNGIALHGGLIPFCSTFFVFSEYMLPAMRMAAIMKLPVIYVFTHDSIGVGEDGATHQPIEQIEILRALPGMRVFRPADYKETVASYYSAARSGLPSAIVLSRQGLPQFSATGADAFRGGYVFSECHGRIPGLVIIASGSELALARDAQRALADKGIDARVVSMPCAEVFDAQSAKYRNSVIPDKVRARIAVEAGSTGGWYRYVGLDGEVIGIDCFGRSGKPEKLFEAFGITVDAIVAKAEKIVERLNGQELR